MIARCLLAASGVLLFLSFGFTEMAGSDLWWHIAAGREIVETGTLWMTDDWSYTASGADWLNHEWGADLIYYAWVEMFGTESLVFWKWSLIVGTFSLLQLTLLRQTENELGAFICAAIAVALAAPFLDVRPHLYTLFFFSLLLYLCFERNCSRWLLVAVFILWVNLHGGFFFGLMALSILIFPWRNFSREALVSALITGFLCLIVSFLNPSGIDSVLFPLEYALDDSSPYRDISEWHSPFREGGIQSPLFFYFMFAPLLAVSYFFLVPGGRVTMPWAGLVLTLLTLAMALTSRRFIPLYGMALTLLIAPLVALGVSAFRWPKLKFAVAVGCLLVGLYRLAPYSFQAAPAFHYLTAEYSYPEDMIDFAQTNGFKGNVFSLYNWGGYLHWRTDGGLKVFIDGRADTVFDTQTYYHYLGVLSGEQNWIEIVENSGADFMLWPIDRYDGQKRLDALRATGRWQAIYQDSVSWLAARDSVTLPAAPHFPPPSPIRELSRAMNLARNGDYDSSLASVRDVRKAVPWQKTACQLEANLLRFQNDNVGAEAALLDCRSYFPTRMLR